MRKVWLDRDTRLNNMLEQVTENNEAFTLIKDGQNVAVIISYHEYKKLIKGVK